jgi:uncharacterized membrane protein YgdD (TMEM256/DUF423 family)
MGKTWVFCGAAFAGLSVILGAFGAHALKDSLTERSLEIYQTASHYQFIHALALILLGIWVGSQGVTTGALTSASGWLFAVGILLFSGSLYALAITDIKILGAITPLGGLCFIAGWTCFALSAWNART